jgi:hypothetical protein
MYLYNDLNIYHRSESFVTSMESLPVIEDSINQVCLCDHLLFAMKLFKENTHLTIVRNETSCYGKKPRFLSFSCY